MAFYDAGAAGQRKAGNDCVAVTLDARGEDVEAGEVALPDGVEPLRQSFTSGAR
ncbi:hypothetical protein ACFU98_41880 [Streptomyces sp. NPDC057575]|uniref:hypothetical protein n=1 Tax=Streptomyces sp. NPDC057575 TaxID=3346170 RepID=UPI00368195A5